MIEQLQKDNILYQHNFIPYIKVKEYYNEYQKFCIVHATGTGKSYISIQLIYDILKEKPNVKFLYVVPRKRIKSQIIYDIEHLPLDAKIRDKIKNSIDFETYGSLTNKNIEELKQYDMAIVDEFQHIGAEIWSKKIEQMRDANIKIFGLSATPVRYEYTSHPINVAESFFDDNVASYYDVVDAMADSVLPIPEYHASIIKLIGDCENLKNNVENGTASNEEKVQFYRMYANIQARIKEKNLMPKDILKKNLKKDGKYIYFVSNINDLERAKKEFLESLTEEERQNIEIYEVYSGYSNKVNNKNHENFLQNISNDGKSAKGKMRVMFSIDMYTEGVHIPDLNGVILGRNTQSERIFNQQIGRALAVSPENKDKDFHPLIIDLAGNIIGMKNLLRKLKSKLEEKKAIKKPNTNYLEDINLDYYLSDELIDIIELFETLKEYTSRIIIKDIKSKIYEFIQYINEKEKVSFTKINKIESTKNIKNIGDFWAANREKIYQEITKEDVKVKYPIAYKIIIEKYNNYLKRKELFNSTTPEKIIELIEYVNNGGSLAYERGEKINQTSSIENVGSFWQFHRQAIYETINIEENKKKYPLAYEVINKKYKNYLKKKETTIEEKIIEFIEYIEKIGYIPGTEGKSIESTPNIPNVGIFWRNNRNRLLEFFENNENQTKYPKTYTTIIKKNEEYLKRKSNKTTFEERILEFIEYINETQEYPKQDAPKKSTKHIKDIYDHWKRNKLIIINTLQDQTIKEKYPNAYKIIIKKDYPRTHEKTDTKIIEFIEYINKKGIILSSTNSSVEGTENIKNTGTFWSSHRKKIYNEIKKEENKEKYPIAYSIIVEEYTKYIIKLLAKTDEWDDKKRTDNIIYICQKNDINYDQNKDILKHISYKELVSKIEFLKANSIPICNKNGKLHEIFTMSSINLEVAFNISLESIINEYFTINKIIK